MALAMHPPANLKVPIGKHHPALDASEAAPMILAHLVAGGRAGRGLEEGALDAAVAGVAHGPVHLVVVLLAVGVVVEDVEVRRGEGGGARVADEAGAVPAAGEAAVGRFDGFAFDALSAAATGGFGARRTFADEAGFQAGLWDGRSFGRCDCRL